MAQALAVVVQEEMEEGTCPRLTVVSVCCVARLMHKDDRAAPIYSRMTLRTAASMPWSQGNVERRSENHLGLGSWRG